MKNKDDVFLGWFLPSIDNETIKVKAGVCSDATPGRLGGSWTQFCCQSTITDFVGADVGAAIWVNRFSGW